MRNHPFFVLLRSGLWGIPAEITPFINGNTDWTTVMKMAQTQGVTGILFDGVRTLPVELRPPSCIYLQWATQVKEIEQNDELLNREVTRLFTLYQKAGLTPILLRGQGIATTYLHPLHRENDGIDIYLGKEGYAIGNRLLVEQEAATVIKEESDRYTDFLLNGIRLRNHRVIGHLNCPLTNSYFQRIVSQWYPLTTRVEQINKYRIALPPPSFNVMYVVVHTLLHLFNNSIQLRQLCDWARLLHTEREHIERSELRHQLRRLGFMTAANTFGYIAVYYLGLSIHKYPFDIDEQESAADVLMNKILLTDEHRATVYSCPIQTMGWKEKWTLSIRRLKHFQELKEFAPRETFWYLLTQTAKRILLKGKQLKGKLPGRKQVGRIKKYCICTQKSN